MSSNGDNDRNLFARVVEHWKLSHWLGAIAIVGLWIAAAYEMITYVLES